MLNDPFFSLLFTAQGRACFFLLRFRCFFLLLTVVVALRLLPLLHLRRCFFLSLVAVCRLNPLPRVCRASLLLLLLLLSSLLLLILIGGILIPLQRLPQLCAFLLAGVLLTGDRIQFDILVHRLQVLLFFGLRRAVRGCGG